jgi:hypothetical protein
MIVRKLAIKTLSALTAGGTLLLGLTLWMPSSHSQSIEKPDTPLKVALVLDSITQPRFQDDMKNFGMSRLLYIAGGHLAMGKLLLPTQKDRDLLKTAESTHRDFAIGFFHCAKVPGKATRGEGSFRSAALPSGKTGKPNEKSKPIPLTPETIPSADIAESVIPVCSRLRHLHADHSGTAGVEEQNLYREMGKAAEKALPKLMKGQGIEQDAGDWLVVARPVRALKTSCLKCHQGAKLGDTLGVLTYIVSKKTFADALPAPTRLMSKKPASE